MDDEEICTVANIRFTSSANYDDVDELRELVGKNMRWRVEHLPDSGRIKLKRVVAVPEHKGDEDEDTGDSLEDLLE